MGRPKDPLATYLNDHDAGAEAALNLLEHLREQHEGSPAAAFLRELHGAIEEDRRTLNDLMDALGVEHQRTKRILADVAERFSRLQLSVLTAGEELSLLMGLDTLTSGVSGKVALWEALEELAVTEPQLAGVDFSALRARASDQLAGITRQRRATARAALADRA